MLKRLIGLLFAAALLAPGTSAPEKEAPVLPILMYHDVRTDGAGKDVVTPGELAEDLRRLRQEGYTAVTMAQVLAYVDEGRPLPEKPIMLSFDDGCQSTVTVVLPLLREYGTPIVLSVIGGSADEFSAMPGENPAAPTPPGPSCGPWPTAALGSCRITATVCTAIPRGPGAATGGAERAKKTIFSAWPGT